MPPQIYDLNDENVEFLAIKVYNGSKWIREEFDLDYERLKYIKRLFGKYIRSDKDISVLKERLILNHIIILGNVFGPEMTTKLLFFTHEERFFPLIKTFLLYLNYLPDYVNSIRGKVINTKEIPIDLKIADLLRKI